MTKNSTNLSMLILKTVRKIKENQQAFKDQEQTKDRPVVSIKLT